MQWAFVEREINCELAWLKTKSRNKHVRVNFQAKFSKRCALWIQMADPIYSQKRERYFVNLIASKAITLKAERDEIAHGTFMGSGDTLQFAKFREGQLIDLPDKPATAADIEDLANRISLIGEVMMRPQAGLDRRYRKRP